MVVPPPSLARRIAYVLLQTVILACAIPATYVMIRKGEKLAEFVRDCTIIPNDPLAPCAYPEPSISFPAFSDTVKDRAIEFIARCDNDGAGFSPGSIPHARICAQVKKVARSKNAVIRFKEQGKFCKWLPELEAEFDTSVFLLGLLAKHDLEMEMAFSRSSV